ncbi:MAG: tetratricopeptide repeat protein [Pseudanabaena sp.]
MKKIVGIAMLTFLSCGQVQIVMSESAQAQTTQDRKAEADRLLQQGNQQFQISQFESAFQSWQQALSIYYEIKDRQGEGAVLGNLGLAYYFLGNYEKAIEYHQKALASLWEIKDRQGEGTVLGNLGLAYYSLGNYEKAIEYHQKALGIAREIKNKLGEGNALGNLGLVYYSLGNYEKAINYHQQRLAIAREIKDREGEGQSLGNLGLAYDALGNYDKAIEFHQQQLSLAKEIKDRRGEGQSLGNLGLAYDALGNYDKAIEFHQQALAIARDIKDIQREGQILGNLGLAYHALSNYGKAIDYQQQRLAIAREIKDRRGEGQSLGNLGLSYNKLGNHVKAIDFYQQALAIAREIKVRLGEKNALGGLSLSYFRLGNYDNAIKYEQQALAIARELKDKQGEGQALGNLGATYYVLGHYDKAIDYYSQALEIVRETKDRDGEGIVLQNIGVLLSNQNQSELAILFYKQSVNVRESIRKDIKKLNKEEQQSYTNTITSSYRRLANLLIKQDRIVEALQVLDLLKVQELEDYFKNIKGSDRSAQGVRLLEPEKAMSDKLLAVSFENSLEINSQLANKIQQLPKSEINKVPDYLQKIPQGTALLYPLILGDRLEIILFSPNTTPISRTVKISQKELETLVTDFRATLLDAGSEDVKEPAAQLYQLLIKPIEAELVQAKTTTILYAPDGILRYIPIAALYDGKQWLAEKYRISNLISYSLFDFSAQPKNSPNILAGAFGGKAGEQKHGQTALPATLKEVQAIANSFTNSVTLIEENFSRQAIESKFKNHNILHLATHAEFNIGVPDNSFIIFGNGDKIRLNEITDWQIPNIDLIVLSACQTGVGKLGDGVEILGFGYQVQKAGAKNAIASLWKVDDAGTQALMVAFYDELKKGNVTSTEALHRAQVSLIKSSEFNHPNYWSAFFAIGNGL